jgi:DnaJ-class molecular chaperone
MALKLHPDKDEEPGAEERFKVYWDFTHL